MLLIRNFLFCLFVIGCVAPLTGCPGSAETTVNEVDEDAIEADKKAMEESYKNLPPDYPN